MLTLKTLSQLAEAKQDKSEGVTQLVQSWVSMFGDAVEVPYIERAIPKGDE